MIALLDITVWAIVWAGFISGFVHVLAGVDHMSALLPLSVGKNWRASLLGVRWGIGHSLGVIVIALLAVELRQVMDMTLELEFLGEWAERLVGLMLIVIGAFGIRAATRTSLHAHSHEHDGTQHDHLHLHAHDSHAEHAPNPHPHSHTAFFAGLLHGVAGTAHVLAVLPAAAMNSRAQSWTYLAAFAVGTVLAMAGFAGIVGFSSARMGKRGPRMLKGLMLTASCVCILVGIAWIMLPSLGYELP